MSSGPSQSDADARALKVATWRLAAITAAAVTLALLVVGALVLVFVVRDQAVQSTAVLRQAVVDTDDIQDQPAEVSVWVRDEEGRERVSDGAPSWFPVRAAVDAVSESDREDDREVTVAGETYKVRTVWKGEDEIVQAAYGGGANREERSRLVQAVVVAEIVGLVLSLLLGLLLARRAIRPLATALDRQRRFVADASHELRTPLTLMSTRAQLLERLLRSPDTSESHEQSLALVADTRRMADVIDDLLVSASLAAEPANREVVDLAAIAADAVSSASAHADQLNVRLVDVHRDGVDRTEVLGVRGPLRRVVDALVDNAVSHTPPGGSVTVEVRGGDRVELRVTDTGPGIDPEVESRMFHRFSHGAPRVGRGSFGLGLSLVREIVEAHDGTVSASNDPSGGAVFLVSLPGRPR